MHSYERSITRRYLANALKLKSRENRDRPDEYFQAWVRTHRQSLGLPPLKCEDESSGEEYGRAVVKMKAEWKKWRAAAIALDNEPAPTISPLQKRIDWLSDACELDASQRYLLGLFARIARTPQVRDLVAAINRQTLNADRFDYSELRPFFSASIHRRELENGLLARFGVIEKDDNDNFWLSDLVDDILSRKNLTPRHVGGLLLGKAAAPSLGWDDFAHLGELRDLAARIACPGNDGIARGVNILLYGAPGVGKSEFAKTLAAHLGLAAHFIGEENGKKAEPSRQERIAALLIANAVGAPSGSDIMVAVDEADDLFAGVDEDNAATRQGSKAFMNRLVERVRTPTVWIVNDIDRLGPAVVRRMNLVIGFPRPSLGVRRKIVERIARRADFRLAADEAEKLARLPASPALIENAIRSAASIEGSAEEASQILESGLQAMGASDFSAPAPLAFDPSLSTADCDLMELANRVKNTQTNALSFCLSGPPGTGKSAYARYLAEQRDMETLHLRYSNLVSAYLGESEKSIARAFEEAADLGAFLIFDEADSLLRDRGAARYPWDVTQVNEMLTSMERHPYPFACTTNAPDLLDPASARRFLFKVRFLPMTPEQIAAAFRHAFKLDYPRSILKLDCLTPGDFALVAHKAQALGERDPARLACWLEEETKAKPEGRRRRMGF
jgi:transitional endoplasmic reticulum ATPase